MGRASAVGVLVKWLGDQTDLSEHFGDSSDLELNTSTKS